MSNKSSKPVELLAHTVASCRDEITFTFSPYFRAPLVVRPSSQLVSQLSEQSLVLLLQEVPGPFASHSYSSILYKQYYLNDASQPILLAKSDVKNICNTMFVQYHVFRQEEHHYYTTQRDILMDFLYWLKSSVLLDVQQNFYYLCRCPLEFLLDIQQSYFSTGRKVSNIGRLVEQKIWWNILRPTNLFLPFYFTKLSLRTLYC